MFRFIKLPLKHCVGRWCWRWKAIFRAARDTSRIRGGHSASNNENFPLPIQQLALGFVEGKQVITGNIQNLEPFHKTCDSNLKNDPCKK